MTSQTFDKCSKDFDSSKNTFSSLKVPESNFEEETESQLLLLKKRFIPYWKRLTSKFTTTSHQTIEGYLWKKSSGIKKWERLYCEVKNHTFYFYHDETTNEHNFIDLLCGSIKPVETERRFSFQLTTNNESSIYATLSQWDCDEWICVIQNNIAYILSQIQTEEPSVSMSKAKEADPSAKIHALTEEIAHKSNVCADCGQPITTQDAWCCINWGIIICINCSGVHRLLSSSISKVRSLSLDSLTEPILEIFMRVGNDAANEILEEIVGYEKIKPTATINQRKQYIINKYQEKLYMKPLNDDINLVNAIKDHDFRIVFKAIAFNSITLNDLMIASAFGNAIIAGLIALNLRDPNILDENGWSCLSYAAYYGKQDIVRILLAIGIDPLLSNEAPPFVVAQSRGFNDIADMIKPFLNGKFYPKSANRNFVVPNLEK